MINGIEPWGCLIYINRSFILFHYFASVVFYSFPHFFSSLHREFFLLLYIRLSSLFSYVCLFAPTVFLKVAFHTFLYNGRGRKKQFFMYIQEKIWLILQSRTFTMFFCLFLRFMVFLLK